MTSLFTTDIQCFESRYTEADYRAVVAILKRNGGFITKKEIFSVTPRSLMQFVSILNQLEVDGHLKKGGYRSELRWRA